MIMYTVYLNVHVLKNEITSKFQHSVHKVGNPRDYEVNKMIFLDEHSDDLFKKFP